MSTGSCRNNLSVKLWFKSKSATQRIPHQALDSPVYPSENAACRVQSSCLFSQWLSGPISRSHVGSAYTPLKSVSHLEKPKTVEPPHIRRRSKTLFRCQPDY